MIPYLGAIMKVYQGGQNSLSGSNYEGIRSRLAFEETTSFYAGVPEITCEKITSLYPEITCDRPPALTRRLLVREHPPLSGDYL